MTPANWSTKAFDRGGTWTHIAVTGHLDLNQAPIPIRVPGHLDTLGSNQCRRFHRPLCYHYTSIHTKSETKCCDSWQNLQHISHYNIWFPRNTKEGSLSNYISLELEGLEPSLFEWQLAKLLQSPLCHNPKSEATYVMPSGRLTHNIQPHVSSCVVNCGVWSGRLGPAGFPTLPKEKVSETL